ncbi:hypothetical protein KR834_19415, partial [Acinetobacter baumannii]|nr:hypothetical protein [Acinetobacter baumannii]
PGADKSNFWGRHHALSIRPLNTCRVARRSPLRCPVPAGAFPKAQIGHYAPQNLRFREQIEQKGVKMGRFFR